MSIWKDLLFLGGHVATPSALDALRDAPAVPAPVVARGAPVRPAVARDARTTVPAAGATR